MTAQLIDRKITVEIAPREDGGLRVWSDDLPGLILSNSDQRKVLADIAPAIIFLLEYKQAHSR